jgi:hypothetical protein
LDLEIVRFLLYIYTKWWYFLVDLTRSISNQSLIQHWIRRKYLMLLILGVKPIINFLLNLCFFEPSWLFYLKFNLSKTISFLKRTWFLYVLWKYQGMFKVLQWNARLWKTPTLKITRSSPGNSIFIGHASNPP